MRSDLMVEKVGRFLILPVLHYSYEFALVARQAVDELRPVGVAVELPFVFQKEIMQGVARLPKVSVLLYRQTVIRMEPVDAFFEALRRAREKSIETRCIDLACDYPLVNDPLPDSYALQSIGHRKYCQMVLAKPTWVHLPQDEQREQAMAFRLKEFERKLEWSGKLDDASSTILVLCGFAHLRGLVKCLQSECVQPEEESIRATLYHLSPQSLGEIMGTFPFLTSVYEIQRSGIRTVRAQSLAITEEVRSGFRVIKGGKLESVEEVAKRAHEETAVEVISSDRSEILTRYVLWCRNYYEQEVGDKISAQQMLLLKKFARKYAFVKNLLLPGFYELLVSGRSTINPHFCFRMWEIGTTYPVQNLPSELPEITLRAADIFPFINKVSMNPQAPLKPRRLPRFLERKKRMNADPSDRMDPSSICSYPPEDVIIENYGRYLRSKGKGMLSEERKRVRPFETSLLDGIDIRETIRNWHTGKLYVQECQIVKGEVDSLVVIFDEDTSKYSYTMTWLGEHNQESDMAFYATDPNERVVGPGIRKAIYGGFLMTMPPGRLYDVFHDPYYRHAANHAERLLMAAIDYSLEKFVIYAAPTPPRSYFQVLAGRYGKRIIYIPLSQLSPVMLQKIRTFHILSNKSVRDYAGDYIW
ncbi:MAG: hypothetical protein RMM17_05960 [Acidobacteriota bacterium]|nr:hypothetical protein [Blastocatellia bacterium]MDW8412212.1 hypothetical protein [Acidobacteriota bacterium]